MKDIIDLIKTIDLIMKKKKINLANGINNVLLMKSQNQLFSNSKARTNGEFALIYSYVYD